MRPLLLCLGFFALLSCASLDEDDCRAGNWHEIGQRDGAKGRSADFIFQHAKACNTFGIAPEAGPWRAGRIEGLKRYCTASNAYRIGTRGQHLAPVCSGDITRLQAANDRGLRWRAIDRDIRGIEREIAAINSQLTALAVDHPSRTGLISQRSFLRLDLLSLHAERARYGF